jgi:ubiquinone biosynthesis protein
VVRAGYNPKALLGRGWKTLLRTLAMAEKLPHDLSRLLRNARLGRAHVNVELAHLKRVGDQINRAANRLSMALVIAALVVGSSIVMNVQGGPTILGLPLFGFLGFVGAVLGGLWLLLAIWRSGRSGDED